MKLIHVFIEHHKSIRSLNVSLGGPFSLNLTCSSVILENREDTKAYYHNHHCSAIIGANGVGKTSILDFIESSLFITDSVGALIFFDETNSSLHACCINMELSNAKNIGIQVYDGLENFVHDHKIKIIKTNNVTEAQSRLGYEKQSNHPLVQNRSLDHYSRLKSRRKRYFDNLLRYFRWSSNSDNIIEDVGFEFNFHDSSEKLARSSAIADLSKNHYSTIESAEAILRTLKETCSNNLNSSKTLTELLFIYNIYPLITDLCSDIKSQNRKQVTAFLYYYLLKSLSFRYTSLQQSFEDAIEALRYAENWNILSPLNFEGSFPADDIDIYQMQETLTQVGHAFRSISFQPYEIPRRLSSQESMLSCLVDDFFSVSEVIGLSNSLPRNALANISWGWRGISTGEMARSHIFSETFDCLSKSRRGNYLIIIDEVDLYLHPEWQRSFLHEYLELLDNMNHFTSRPQILLTTHSPIIISDFLPGDIASLSKDNNGVIHTRKSFGFGTNITNLFIDGMHVDSTFGEHSRRAITALMKRAKEGQLTDFDKTLIEHMGNTYIRDFLLKND